MLFSPLNLQVGLVTAKNMDGARWKISITTGWEIITGR